MLTNLLIDNLPKFSIKRPTTNKLIYFRPIVVKEEKKLLMAQELGTRNDIVKAVSEVLQSCYEDLSIKNIPIYEFDYLFTQLRIKSIGENIDAKFICPETGEKISLNINLSNIKITNLEKFNNKINISESLIFTFRAPSYKDIEDFDAKEFTYEDMIKLTSKCLVKIVTKDEELDAETYKEEDKIEMINSLTSKQFLKILDFFDNLPKFETSIDYKTSDNVERKLFISGIDDFFTLASVT